MSQFGFGRNQYDQQELQQRGRNMGQPQQGFMGGGYGQPPNQGGGVTYGAPAARPQYEVQGFDGLAMGGSAQLGDLRIDNPNAEGFYDSYNRTYGDIATSQIGADASRYNSDNSSKSSMYDSLMRLLGIKEQTGSSNYQTDASREVALAGQEVDRYGIDSNASVSRDQFENQYNIADITSGRSLEGEKYSTDGRSDVARTQADSARDVADLQNLRYKLEDGQFDKKMTRFDAALAGMGGGGGGLAGYQIPQSAGLERLNPDEALNAAYAQNARMGESSRNQAGGGGASPQASARGQRADLQEMMANQQARTEIIPSYANANNQNRLAELAALAEQRRAATQDRDGLLGFLSAIG
jgi:hypothetical protein